MEVHSCRVRGRAHGRCLKERENGRASRTSSETLDLGEKKSRGLLDEMGQDWPGRGAAAVRSGLCGSSL